MNRLVFYDTNQQDEVTFKAQFPAANCYQQPLGDDNLDAEAEVISTFVTSKITADVLARLPKLQLIACRSTGYDNVDLAAARERNIIVCNVPNYGGNTVAEYAFGLMLSLTRKIPQSMAAFQAGQTEHSSLTGSDLMGKTLGIIGTGRIGCQVAAIGRGFGMPVVAFDAQPDNKKAHEYGFTYQSLEYLLQQSDIISLHVPLLDSTRHLIDANKFNMMKPTAIILNTARGEIIDTQALVEALQSRRIAGAALDVFESEALIGIDEELRMLRAQKIDQLRLKQAVEIDVLSKLPNVVLTNHNAFNTVEAIDRINQTTIENIKHFTAGQPNNVVSG